MNRMDPITGDSSPRPSLPVLRLPCASEGSMGASEGLCAGVGRVWVGW